jgi:hypothetical protein
LCASLRVHDAGCELLFALPLPLACKYSSSHGKYMLRWMARRLLGSPARKDFHMRRIAAQLLAVAVLAAPSLAAAQVVFVAPPPPLPPPPPPVFAPPPPIFVPPVGAIPPHVYIRERVRWHLRHLPRVYVGAGVIAVPPPPVVVVPAPLPPPVYVEPQVMPLPPVPPPIIVPPPCCWAQPVYAPSIEVARPLPPVPAWRSRIGLGVRGTGAILENGWNSLGIGGEFLFRASPHLVTELAAEYDHSTATPLDRIDVPVTIGLRVHIGRPNWIVSPYFVFAAGVDIAQQDMKFTTDQSIYVDGQLGGGLELRLGQHFAITADARFDAKKRANEVAQNIAATISIDGKPFHPLGDELGGQFRLGAAVYF